MDDIALHIAQLIKSRSNRLAEAVMDGFYSMDKQIDRKHTQKDEKDAQNH